MEWPLEARRSLYVHNLYYNCTKDCRFLASRQKKYEILVNMKKPSYTWQKKYENLVKLSSSFQVSE